MQHFFQTRSPRGIRRHRGALCVLALLFAALLCSPARAEAPPVRLPVVMYHQLCREESCVGKYCLPLEQFEDDLRCLREQGYESVSIRTLLDWSRGRAVLPDKPVMITFDDGYLTTAVWAAPLLEQYGFTGVIAPIGSVAQTYTDTPDERLEYAHCSWPCLSELAAGGVMEVQYHSWDMHQLDTRRGCNKMPGESFEDYSLALTGDFTLFREAAARYGVPLAPAAAFPFGSYCQETLKILYDQGMEIGFTCSEQVNLLHGDPTELLELGRDNRPAGPDSASFFAAWQP